MVVTVAFVENLVDRHNAHLTALSSLTTLSVAFVAWLLWTPMNHLALEPGSNAIVVMLDDMFASIFIGGLVGTVVGLLPLRAARRDPAKWCRDAWAGVFFVALFVLIEVELRPAAGPTHPGGAPIATAVILFVVFGSLSFGMRAFFARRHRAAAALPPPAPSDATTPEGGAAVEAGA